jgi:hypothetical protein
MSQVFVYDPRVGVRCVDTTGLRYVDTRQLTPEEQDYVDEKKLIDNERRVKILAQKLLDNLTNPNYNILMCKQVKFVTAVALAIQDIRSSPFSAFNVTQKLREWVNKGDVAFTDKSPEDVDGVTTYRIEHQEVRSTVHELINNGVVQGLDTRDTGRFIEYFESAPIQCVSPTPTPQAPTNPRAGHTPLVSVCQPSPLPADADLRQKLQDYLKGRAGQNVTMKEVQSRFKGVSKTCQEWAKLVANIGLPVNSSGTPSFWTTHI